MKKPHPRSWLIRYLIGVFSLLLCSVLTKFSVEGKENLPQRGPYILAPNHIDDVDPAPITAAVIKPITYLMAEDQAKLPWYKAWGPWSYGVLLVNRSNLQISTIKNIQKQIQKKERICIFPEGTIKGEGLKKGKNIFFLTHRVKRMITVICMLGWCKDVPVAAHRDLHARMLLGWC